MFASTFVVSLFFSYLGSLVLFPVLKRLRIYDIPNHRTVHEKPMLEMGGLIFIIGYFSSLLFVLFVHNPVIDTSLLNKLIGILGGGIAIIILGALDDLLNLKPITKFVVESVIALFICQCGIIVQQLTLFGYSLELGVLATPFTIVWIVGIINAVNMMDGLDGLSGGICLIILSSIAVHQPENVLVNLMIPGLLGGILIFLSFNWYPAKIFMGDVGSLFLGYHIAIFSILIVGFNSHSLGLMAPIFLLGLPIFDTLMAMTRRAKQNKPIFKADKMHVHHQLLNLGIRHSTVVKSLCSINLTLAIIVYFAKDKSPESSTIIILGTILLIIYLMSHLMSLQYILKTNEISGYEKGVKNTIGLYLQANNYKNISFEKEQLEKSQKMQKLEDTALKIFCESNHATIEDLANRMLIGEDQKSNESDSKQS